MLPLLVYKQEQKHEDLIQKLVQCWSEVTDELLHEYLESVDCFVFQSSVINLNGTNLTDFIGKCVKDCMSKNLIRVFPNRKLWMTRMVYSQLKSMSEVSKSGDPDLYRKS
eukprot:g24690.t1